jgi:hypothetical protein
VSREKKEEAIKQENQTKKFAIFFSVWQKKFQRWQKKSF